MTTNDQDLSAAAIQPPAPSATPLDVEFARAPCGTLSEWTAEADERAYTDL